MQRDPRGAKTTLPEPWAALALALGSVESLAASLQVSRTTIWRWSQGAAPRSVAVRRRVEIVARRHGVADPFA